MDGLALAGSAAAQTRFDSTRAMHRYGLERPFAALLLLWFAVITGELAALHSCPVHDAPASAPAGGTAHAHDAHSVRPASHSPSHPIPERDDGHRSCTCIDDCNAGAVAAGIPGARMVLVVAGVRQIRVELPPAESPGITAPAFLLPYANGPPHHGRVA